MGMNEFLIGLAALLGTYLIHSTVMLGGAWLACRWLKPSTGMAETLWRTALVAPVLTAALSVNLSVAPLAGTITWFENRTEFVREIEPVGRDTRPVPAEQAGLVSREDRVEVSQALPAPGAPQAAAPPAPATPGDIETRASASYSDYRGILAFGAAVWLLIAAFLTMRWLRGARAGRRLLAARRPLASGAAHEALLRLKRRTGTDAPPLSLCNRLGGPATLPSGEICIPAWALELPPAQLEAMLAHELAHVERRDPWWLASAVAIESLFWIQPFNRLARHRLASLAEIHADARAAELMGNGRDLAHCLAHCAERMNAGHMPVLAAAMARQGGALSERVQKLVTNSTETGGIPMSRKFMIFTGVMALVMVLPSVAVLANKSQEERNSSIEVHESDSGTRSMSLSFTDDGMRMKLRASGDVAFAADGSGIDTLGPGSMLEVIQEAGEIERRLLANGTGNGIEYSYYENGETQPYDADARAWFTGIMPMVLRETAINAPERVEYILESQGHDAVLDEIAKIRSDYARRRYIEAYVATGELPVESYDRLVEEASKIGSDFELRNALRAIYETQRPRGDRLADLIGAAKGIGSDFEVRQLLTGFAEDAVRDEEVLKAYAEAAGRIGSDFELRQALSTLIEADEGSSAVYAALPLTKLIGSDFELRVLLEKAAPIAAQDERLGIAWLGASARIGSDFEMRQALTEFANQEPSSVDVWRALFETARNIASDHECSSFLVDAADHMPDDPVVEEAFRSVMETIGSDSDYRRVAQAIEK